MNVFQITASSVAGCVRENNEDMVLVGQHFLRNDSLNHTATVDDSQRFLCALADGMGGHNCGEVASSDVLENLQYFYSDMPNGLSTSDFNEAIYEWLSSMNNTMEAKGRVTPECKDMGTTLVALALYEGRFYWMNCGDSRLYRLHEGKLQQLSTDHSLSNLTGEKSHSHIITNCIGGGCKSSYIDIVECSDQVASGDTFLLCSDGLSDMLDDATIERLLNDGSDANGLCRAAEAAGGFDNVSVALIHVE